MGEVDNGARSYDDMSIEQLEAEFANTGGVIQDDPVDEPAPVDEPEQNPAQEVAATDGNHAEQSDQADPQAADEPQEVELDDRDLQLQELQLQLERERVGREQANLIATRNAGKMGHLQKQLEQLAAERNRPTPASDSLDYEDDPTAESARFQPQPPVVPSRYEDEVAELRIAHRANMVKEVYSDFLNRLSEDLTAQGVPQDKIAVEQQSLIEQITPTLKDRFEPFGELDGLKSQTLGKITRMVLDSAYTDAKLQKIADLRRRSAERRATQISESRIVKQAASSSGSGGRPAKEPPPKSVDDMTAEEADAALIAQFGTGQGNLRARR
jgi:hypothetical protein